MARYPETEGLGWHIVIAILADRPDARSAEVIARVGDEVRELGGDLLIR